MNVKRVGNLIIAVKNLEKSVEFYNKILGMPIKSQRKTWVDLGVASGALLSLHPAADDTKHVGGSIENGITIGFLVGDVEDSLEELRSKGVRVHRETIEKDAGKNAAILDPDGYLISLFEPIFRDKESQMAGYQGFTPE
ncbi:MAG: VOC family protein [Nitrosopumilus sp.]